MKTYIYKLKHKYITHTSSLLKYGFIPYVDEESDEIIYGKGIVLPKECSITKYLKGALEKCYKYASNEEKEKDFSDYKFTKNGKLILNKKIHDEFTLCQLCFASAGLGAHSLFINAPDHLEYYDTKTLEECVPDIIEKLLNEGVIYKKKVRRKK